jgi:hypothetical protein
MVEMTDAWVEVPSRDIVDWAEFFRATPLHMHTMSSRAQQEILPKP